LAARTSRRDERQQQQQQQCVEVVFKGLLIFDSIEASKTLRKSFFISHCDVQPDKFKDEEEFFVF